MIWIIGDIHARFDPLKRLVNYIEILSLRDERFKIDKFVFLGDYIDYGVSSKEVVDFIIALDYNKVLLAGNHEDLLLQFYNKSDMFRRYGNVWFRGNGGQETVASFGVSKEVLLRIFGNSGFSNHTDPSLKPEDCPIDDKYMEFFSNLSYSHVESFDMEDYSQGAPPAKLAFVHAGLNDDLDIEEQLNIKSYDDFHKFMKEKKVWIENMPIWTRKEPEKKFGDYVVIHGHTPTNTLSEYYENLGNYDVESGFPYLRFKQFDQHANKSYSAIEFEQSFNDLISVNMDTGAAYGYKLSALGIDYNALISGEFYTVQVDVGASQRKLNDIVVERFALAPYR